MTKPLVAFADPVKSVIDRLRDQLPSIPTRAFTSSPMPVEFLLVRQDGPTAVRYPVAAATAVRVIAWARDEFDAADLAQRAQIILVTHPGNADVRSIGSLTGPLVATDDQTNRPLAYITVEVRSRPTVYTP